MVVPLYKTIFLKDSFRLCLYSPSRLHLIMKSKVDNKVLAVSEVCDFYETGTQEMIL